MHSEADSRETERTAASSRATSGETGDAEVEVPQRGGAAVEAVPAGGTVLVIARGPIAGRRFPLDVERTLAGRHEDAEIVLDDVTVSRQHAEFLTHEGVHMVRDVGSLNGTYVNGRQVDAAVLGAGDEVQIGKYRLTYLADAEPA